MGETKNKHPKHLPVNVFVATHEMLKDWYMEPDSQISGKQVLVVRQVKFDGEAAEVKCVRIPQDQWGGLLEALTEAVAPRFKPVAVKGEVEDES